MADTGIGIPQEMLPVIFEPFRQLESPITRTHGGVGLGLYITKKMLELLGGSINVESEARKGSTFRVVIPTGESIDHNRTYLKIDILYYAVSMSFRLVRNLSLFSEGFPTYRKRSGLRE